MADEPNHERKKDKKQKKKHKKKQKKLEEKADAPEKELEDSQTSAPAMSKEKPAPEKSQEVPKPKQEELAAKSKLEVAGKWTPKQKEQLLREVLKCASSFNGKNFFCHRIDWSKIELDNFTESELEDEFKRLTKTVRKMRTVEEIVEDALHKHMEREEQNQIKGSKPKRAEKGPAKPLNAFMQFCHAKRQSLVKKHPKLTFAEIHKKMCERWKEMPDSKKEKYVKKYEKAKAQYVEELKEFQKKQISDIKKPMSAFEMWKAERLEDPGLEGDELESDFIVEWDNIPQSMKKGWLQAAECERVRYEAQVNSICGSVGQVEKTVKKMGKSNNKDASTRDETGQKKEKKEETSDDSQKIVSLKKSSSQKRKMDDSNEPTGSPLKKLAKSDTSDNEDNTSEDSSEDE